ncbi:conjugal transfer protein TraC [Escherichia coli O5]|nr:conjugal transfer protein TraC [Escherichia coli O5]
MGHRSQQSPVTLKYRDSHNGSHSPLTFFRKSRFADVDVPQRMPSRDILV